MERKKKSLFSVLLTICLMVFTVIPVWAEGIDSINAVRNGVLQVNLNWIDNNGKAHPIQGGSGFLINDQTLLTNSHVVQMNDETKTAASQAYGVDFVNDTKLDVRPQIVVQRDVVIDATVRTMSEEMDVAVLELSEPIYDRATVTLGDSDSVTEAGKIYALGFPQLPELAQDVQYYTNADVTVTDGIVAKKIQSNGTPFIQHSAKISNGNSGGPLVNENGQVIGINTSRITQEEGYYYAMDINEIKSLLNALGVSYNEEGDPSAIKPGDDGKDTDKTNTETTGEDGETDIVPGETEEVDVTALERTVEKAEEKELEDTYTEETLKTLTDKLDKAHEVLDDANSSQEMVDKAEEDLSDAIKGLEEKSGMGMMLWIIIGVIVVAVIAVVVVLIVSSNKKAKKAEQDRERIMRQRTEENKGTVAAQRTVPNYAQPAEGAGETSVLGEGRGETTVLNATQTSAYMIRRKNNERVTVSGPSFTVGKERSRVNYCISDNTSVSRCHARITRKGAQYFVSDMNSTNFTFVNGVKVMPGQEVQLNDGDMIRFADEDFEFHAN